MKRQMRSLAGILLAMSVTVGTVLNVDAVTIDEAEQKADELEKQKADAESEKADLAEKLSSIIDDMQATQTKLIQKEEEVEKVENELVQARIDANNQYESMKVRIKFMYEGGNTQFMEMLFESENMGDFLNKAEYVSQISEYDRNELIRYQETVKQVEEKEEQIQAEYEKLNDLQARLVDQQDEVEKLIKENASKISDLQAQIDENAETLEELKEKAAEAERIRQEQMQNANNVTITKPGESVVTGNGYFTHPCPGMSYQSSYFGEIREFEVGGHRGHDYAAATGTPTYAAAAGYVVTANYSPSAGNWVVIDHGNGLTTKYMHHSSLCVSQGQYVEKGQQIGCVGSTGQSTGPHLHFQVEEYGVPVNPDKYL